MFLYLFNKSLNDGPKGALSDIADITMGQSPSGNSYNDRGEGVPFFQCSTDFGAIYPTVHTYTTNPARFASIFDTLLSVRAPVGSINTAFENCCIGRGLASIRGKNNNNTFVRYLLKNSLWYFDKLNRGGTTFGSITKNYLFDMPIIIPNEHDVELFEQKASTLEHQIFVNELQNRRLLSLRNFILPMLINGQATFSS